MDIATDVLLVGSSSGAMAVLLQADYFGSLLPTSARYGVVEDAGWYRSSADLSWELDRGDFMDKMRVMYHTMQMSTNAACEAAFADAPWKCLLPINIFPFIQSKVFILEPAYDTNQLINILKLTCSTYGQDLSGCTSRDMADMDAMGEAT